LAFGEADLVARGLFVFFNFIFSCDFGFIRTRAPIRFFVACIFRSFAMAEKPQITRAQDGTLNVTINVEEWHNANAEFMFCYGRAMAEWASVERGLYYWFAGITRMKDGLARAIFYGAKGFSARAEMLESVIPFAEQQTPEEITFIKEALRKAGQFVGFRNGIAHGEPIPTIMDDGIHVLMGKAKDVTDRDNITIKHMEIAAENFSRLASAIINAIPRQRKGKPLSEYLAQVRELPNQAHLEAANPPSAPLQQYPGAKTRVDKKAFRAAQAAARENPPEKE
jgi:hypothetical protein